MSDTPPVCTSGDGIPDAWKTGRKLDPTKQQANGRDLRTAYDNVEVYFNSLVENIMTEQNKLD